MTIDKPVVLLVGVTGMLGHKVADAILSKGANRLRALVRAGSTDDPKRKERLEKLEAAGATLVEGNMMEPDSLAGAMEGVHTVVSTIGNDPEQFVTGQTNLLRAAEQAGVKRFIPSDFSSDYHAPQRGENFNMDMRKDFFAILQQSSIAWTSIANGAFTDVMVSPFMGLLDPGAGVLRFWGEGNEPLDLTTTDDTALYTAEAVADEGLLNQTLEVVGEVITYEQIASVYEQVIGKSLVKQKLGSVEDLERAIEAKKAEGRPVSEYLPLQYAYVMVSGRGKLHHIANDRYPHIQPLTFKDYLQKAGQNAFSGPY